MLEGWPDALSCGGGTHIGLVFFLKNYTSDRVVYQVNQPGNLKQVQFNADKTWHSAVGDYIKYTESCDGKTIDTLIAEKLAISFYPTRKSSNSGSILQKKPDAITCGSGVIFYAHKLSAASESIYKAIDSTNDNYVKFNADGTFNSRNTNFSTNSGCNGKSLLNLYDDCKAYNFVSSKPASISGANTDTFINEWPYAIDCSSDSNTKVVFLAQSQNTNSNTYYFEASTPDNYYEFKANGDYNHYKEANNNDGNNMYPGYPDTLQCLEPSTGRGKWFLLKTIDYVQGFIIYEMPGQWSTRYYVAFNFDGSFNQQGGNESQKCQDWTLDQIYADGRAYNIVTSKTLVGANTDTLATGRPDSIMCISQSTKNRYIFYHERSNSLLSEYKYMKSSTDRGIK